MDFTVTLTLLGLAVTGALLFGWLGARPPDPRGRVRLMPWRFLMLLSAAAALPMLVHLLNLAGMKTGR